METNVISIPVDKDSAVGAKRITVERNHWLEITCGKCGYVHDDGKQFAETIFHYGVNTRAHWCAGCNDESDAFVLERIENGCAVISKVPTFSGTIKHCFFVKSEGNTI